MRQGGKLLYLAAAREDILDIARFHLERVGPKSARKITEEIERKILKLADFPLLGPSHPDEVLANHGYRKLVLLSPYVCIYKPIDGDVYIYRIVNGAIDYPKLLY